MCTLNWYCFWVFRCCHFSVNYVLIMCTFKCYSWSTLNILRYSHLFCAIYFQCLLLSWVLRYHYFFLFTMFIYYALLTYIVWNTFFVFYVYSMCTVKLSTKVPYYVLLVCIVNLYCMKHICTVTSSVNYVLIMCTVTNVLSIVRCTIYLGTLTSFAYLYFKFLLCEF